MTPVQPSARRASTSRSSTAGDLHLHDATHDHARAAGTGCAAGVPGGGTGRRWPGGPEPGRGRPGGGGIGRVGAGAGCGRGGGQRGWAGRQLARLLERSRQEPGSTGTGSGATGREPPGGTGSGDTGCAAAASGAVRAGARVGARVGGTRRALFPGRTGCRSPYRRPHDPDPAAPGLRWPPSRDRECVPWSRSGATTPCVSDRCCSPWWTRPRATRSPTTVGTNRTTSTPGASSAPGCSPVAAGSAPGS